MALGQVGARTEGDVYQGLFFWQQAANLLRPSSMVERVVLEHDAAAGVDDVAVFYRYPGVNAGGWIANADYYQLKYHVDNRSSYTADALVDPSFSRTQSSLLQRFYTAYTELSKEHSGFRLHLASNWQWRSNDKLAALLRDCDGALPRRFFTDGQRGELGRIREQWRDHLGLESEVFDSFARTLRLKLDHFGRRDFKAYVYATLEAAGLRIPSADRAACPYESLVQQFLMNSTNVFDADTLRDLCRREGLLVEGAPRSSRPMSVGVRSFVRFAERLESEVDEFVCVSSCFEGRCPVSDTSWKTSASRVIAFLGDADRRARLRSVESAIALECHGSLAMLAGWELSRNSGVRIAPIQKPNLDVWRPDEGARSSATWMTRTIETDHYADDVAICLSVTRDVYSDVEEYLASTDAPHVGRIVLLSPEGGPSPQSIHGADDAYQLALQLPTVLSSARPNHHARAHIFFACPNSLMFFIGQQREALGRLMLYEFDFALERNELYLRSFLLPISPYEGWQSSGDTK